MTEGRFFEWDITQWVDYTAGVEDDRPEGGLSFVSWAASGPGVPKELEWGKGWLTERAEPDAKYNPLPNEGDLAYSACLAYGNFPSLGPYRLFTRFNSDVDRREINKRPPRSADMMEWLKANCIKGGEVIWTSSMTSAPFGGVALVALYDEQEYILAKLRFKEVFRAA